MPGLLADDGWRLAGAGGSDVQYEHRSEPGLVTVVGTANDGLAPGTALGGPIPHHPMTT